MRSVLVRAMKNLAGHPQNFHGIEVSELLKSLAQWLDASDSSQPLPALPRINATRRGA